MYFPKFELVPYWISWLALFLSISICSIDFYLPFHGYKSKWRITAVTVFVFKFRKNEMKSWRSRATRVIKRNSSNLTAKTQPISDKTLERNAKLPVECNRDVGWPWFRPISPRQKCSPCALLCRARPRETIRRTARSLCWGCRRRIHWPIPSRSGSGRRGHFVGEILRHLSRSEAETNERAGSISRERTFWGLPERSTDWRPRQPWE